ncbi:MAG: hypothetical protein DMF89_14765 [Acidobacteria bacterium]|nr:MAG: hypothetical protein DMF89_14765 [Acidobacteriota bacterium]
MLGRAPWPHELRDETRHSLYGDQKTVLRGLLSSREFETIRSSWLANQEPHPDLSVVEAGLQTIGPDDAFIAFAYSFMLGRDVDAGGARHYADLLRSGAPRSRVIRALALSDEFERRRLNIPRDAQLCELANPAKWDNEEWTAVLRSLGLTDDKFLMHRKPYEFTQLIFGCRHLGVLTEDAVVVSVGAGHELVLYWLTNHVHRVVATDRYEGVWQDQQGREEMDGRQLGLRSGFADVVYSLSSIEHFGGVAGATTTIREMARVLRPGGVLALATEYVLAGPPHEETFQPDEIALLLRQPDLELVQPVDELVYQRYQFEPVDLYATPYRTPHMVVRFNDTVFTTVMAFLRKR